MREGLLLWVRTDHLTDSGVRHRTVLEAVQRGFSEIVVRREDAGMTSSANFIPILLEGGDLLMDGRKAGRFVHIRGEEDMPDCSKSQGEYLVVETSDWKVIPLENLIAKCSASGVKLIASVGSVSDAKLFSQTLEKGVDGVLITPKGPEAISEFSELTESKAHPFKLEVAEVQSVEQAGMGDRVCVDTTSLLDVGEGMLVGSQSSVFFLVHSESLQSKYVDSRPFRVNAGPVHSYVAMPGDRTGYLSELSSGKEVLAVSTEGQSRKVTVGRVKIERRPLMLVKAVAGGRECSVMLQNAETVNLCSKEGFLPVTSLKKGDHVLVHIQEGGRHFGMKVTETIHER